MVTVVYQGNHVKGRLPVKGGVVQGGRRFEVAPFRDVWESGRGGRRGAVLLSHRSPWCDVTAPPTVPLGPSYHTTTLSLSQGTRDVPTPPPVLYPQLPETCPPCLCAHSRVSGRSPKKTSGKEFRFLLNPVGSSGRDRTKGLPERSRGVCRRGTSRGGSLPPKQTLTGPKGTPERISRRSP